MAKGANYERVICKEFSLWLSNGKTDDCFWRSSQSGGRATTRAKRGKKTEGHAGDITATSKEGRKFLKLFAVEIKCGYSKAKNVDIGQLLSSKPGLKTNTLPDWIKQARRSRRQSNVPNWMLIHKADRREPVVYVNIEVFENLFHPSPPRYTGQMTFGKKKKFDVGFLPLRLLYKIPPNKFYELMS